SSCPSGGFTGRKEPHRRPRLRCRKAPPLYGISRLAGRGDFCRLRAGAPARPTAAKVDPQGAGAGRRKFTRGAMIPRICPRNLILECPKGCVTGICLSHRQSREAQNPPVPRELLPSPLLPSVSVKATS
ncbi:hypothetical protein Celaphus_00002272, partial [Cervus elaphus hippelaphus]